jgi:hypothetical protein
VRTGRRAAWIAAFAIVLSLFCMLLGCGADTEKPVPAQIPDRQPLIDAASVEIVHDVIYGSNVGIDGETKTLKLDVYLPQTGIEEQYPLVVLLPGGGFAPGTSRAQYDEFATALACYGFIVACADYRVSDGRTLDDDAIRTLIVQGMQDAKAAVRFFREDAAHGNQYHINTDEIFLGGFSAGAMVSAHAVYLDDLEKADDNLRKVIELNGGLEGDSGHPEYDSSVRGWIGMAGCLIDARYITADSKPLIAIYSVNDVVVDPGEDVILSTNVEGSGCRSLYQRAEAVGIEGNALVPIGYGAHVVVIRAATDEVVARIVAFIEALR